MGRWVTLDDGRAAVIRQDGKSRNGAMWRVETR
jgi:hypothetical protein